jgi:antitoxin (DNA-binding transcriptional repressor) of toxin-antitoxin stability system
MCVIFVYTRGYVEAAKVGIREFRENLSTYLEASKPVAITRHGATIGFYVPARHKPNDADLAALRAAGAQMQALIAAAGTSEDQIVAEFKKARRSRRTSKG